MSMWSLRWQFTNKSVAGAPYSIKGYRYSLSHSQTSAGRTSADIGASAKVELVDKFCYLGDMLSVDGDADAAVEARIRIG